MDPRLFRLLNDWQQDFPRVSEPFCLLSKEAGLPPEDVLRHFQTWSREGVVSRIGPVFNQTHIGTSALVALAVPIERLETVAAFISAMPEVNHNYEREHFFNLWFVVLASNEVRFAGLMAEISRTTGLEPLVLPMEESYHINLGFDLLGRNTVRGPAVVAAKIQRGTTKHLERKLLSAMQNGIPLTHRPYEDLGIQVGITEAQVFQAIDHWLSLGLLRRFGVILRHHELGYTANAMCVWDVADSHVEALGQQLGMEPGVALCYRRRRFLPHWRYNLFCMIHGKEREQVLAKQKDIAGRLGLNAWPNDILFSGRRFKQRGAQFATS